MKKRKRTKRSEFDLREFLLSTHDCEEEVFEAVRDENNIFVICCFGDEFNVTALKMKDFVLQCYEKETAEFNFKKLHELCEQESKREKTDIEKFYSSGGTRWFYEYFLFYKSRYQENWKLVNTEEPLTYDNVFDLERKLLKKTTVICTKICTRKVSDLMVFRVYEKDLDDDLGGGYY